MEKHKILVVDDNADNAEQIVTFLDDTDKSFLFFLALNGKTACSIAEKKLPDLIITDWEMPVMDGIELIKHLKSMECTKDIPIIMCTGVMTKTENLKAALDAGAVDFIRKPVENLELTARVHSMLKLSESMKKIKEQNEELQNQKEEIEAKNIKLIELNATKDKFFSIIAHDLRSPFQAILGFSQLLEMKVYNQNQEITLNFVQNIRKSAENTLKLLVNLLEWARSQTGKIKFSPQIFSIGNLVNEAILLADSAASNKNITISSTLTEDFKIYADRNMINTVLRNLISNAIKFTTRNGKIVLKVSILDNAVLIVVSDTGIGIVPEKMQKLFNINEKVYSDGTEDEKGTGLGLILCKEFVEKHGGTIWVESEVGKGSDFKFTIPLRMINSTI